LIEQALAAPACGRNAAKLSMVKRSRTKFPGFEQGCLRAQERNHQMCLIHRDFKHFAAGTKPSIFGETSQGLVNHRAKLLSIMREDERRVTTG
jgi:hypothetical protein